MGVPRFDQVLPARNRPVGARHGQDQVARGCDDGDDEGVYRAGQGWKDVSRCQLLVLEKNAIRAWMSAVVDAIVAVPSAARGAHLRQPWPDALRRCVNRNR